MKVMKGNASRKEHETFIELPLQQKKEEPIGGMNKKQCFYWKTRMR